MLRSLPPHQCDRVQPCQACCARGQPKDCNFAVSEKDDYEPIKQSYEIRELRKENQRLKERLRNLRDSTWSPEHSNDDGATDPRPPPKVPTKPSRFQQRRFKAAEPPDSLYFGSPGLANVVADVRCRTPPPPPPPPPGPHRCSAGSTQMAVRPGHVS